jgi:hypothetical protein
VSGRGIRARARERDGAVVVFLWALVLAVLMPALWVLFENRLEPVLATAGVAVTLIVSGAALLDRGAGADAPGWHSWPTVAFAVGLALMVAGAAFGVWLGAAGGAVAAFGAANMVFERRRPR